MVNGVNVIVLLLLLVHIIFDLYLQTEERVRVKEFDNGIGRALYADLFHGVMLGFFLCLSCFALLYVLLGCTNILIFLLFVLLFSLFT
ncbi:DUF3307 domain-containing protein, partial [Salmonella enterica subsp. enterica serovar 1,4,[5],12:i:-]|nr:DUF3307 domain-containing protein [Salmonella enterica subsp. enterica serovar 1,4,[5],12:i:-]